MVQKVGVYLATCCHFIGIDYKNVIIIFFCRQRGQQLLNSDPLDDASVQSPQSPVGLPSSYGQIRTPGASSDVTSTGSFFPRCHSDSSLDETDIDILQDADSDKDVFRFEM
jgi:hypothetical protein